MTNIEIQKVTLENIDQLQKIGRQTFFETFSSGNTEENMKKYLDEELFVLEYDIHKGASFFVPCINWKRARRQVLCVTDRLGMEVIIKPVVEEGIRGLRVWRM